MLSLGILAQRAITIYTQLDQIAALTFASPHASPMASVRQPWEKAKPTPCIWSEAHWRISACSVNAVELVGVMLAHSLLELQARKQLQKLEEDATETLRG